LVLGFFIFILLILTVFVERHLERTHYPKIIKLETVKFDLALLHLQIEEGALLLDSTFNNSHILEAKQLVKNLLPKSREDYIMPLANAQQQKNIKIILQKITKLEVLLKSYEPTPENSIKHDAIYLDLVISIQKLQDAFTKLVF